MDDETNTAEFGDEPVPSGLARGVEAIRAALATLPGSPGVYRMLDDKGEALYVGKARNLKRRVAQYLQFSRMPNRLQRMVAETRTLEVITTHTEIEALLLESNLIKRLTPRYNVLLRDDKSFPYIAILKEHEYPQLAKHRGSRDRKGSYFGPFASAGAVNQTLTALQRAFLLRSCADTVFAGRTRPCLLYQIKRCSAPCVGRISVEDYGQLVRQAEEFLSGRSHEVQADLAQRMQSASDTLDFERAALFRDRIRALTQIQARQDINIEGVGDADVIAAHQAGGQTCIQVFFFRNGRNYGNRAYFPRADRNLSTADVLGAFLPQFYDDKPAPPLILLSEDIAERELLADALTQKMNMRVRITVPERGDKRKPVEHALANAREALARRLSESASQSKLLEGVAAAFGLEAPPTRIEVYDNSHIAGQEALGAMIVAGPEGFIKNAYRKFNIRTAAGPDNPEGITPGDDYGMMREVLTRRFGRALKEDPGRTGGTWPDLVLIDGGQGQLNAAQQAMADLGISDIPVVAIAKGPDRDAGRERFFMAGRPPFQLEPRDPVLYFLQRLRDEAHRFAIGGHRARRARTMVRSPLDEIAGIGPSRKKALLLHFGSAKAVSRAGLADLENVPGINRAVARKIYDHFHGGS
ncbi:MAG TPA: excinuclease ABC subunit UvrC [Alphaproteobacteria bacterium]